MELELWCWPFDRRVLVWCDFADRSNSVFTDKGNGHLPSLFAYPLDATEAQAIALAQYFARLQSAPPPYHAEKNNCINIVRQALRETGICEFVGDDWDPGTNPGTWRPDKFNEFVANQRRQCRRLRLGWDAGSRRRATEAHSYQWTEAPASARGGE